MWVKTFLVTWIFKYWCLVQLIRSYKLWSRPAGTWTRAWILMKKLTFIAIHTTTVCNKITAQCGLFGEWHRTVHLKRYVPALTIIFCHLSPKSDRELTENLLTHQSIITTIFLFKLYTEAARAVVKVHYGIGILP